MGERLVTAVVVAAFDPAGDRVVERVVARAGGRVPPRHRPHLTLGAAKIPEGEIAQVSRIAELVAGRHEAFAVELGGLGIFPPGVLWLAPRPEPALRGLQAGVDAALTGAGHERAFGAHADPDHWIAHCTLATGLRPDRLGAAVTAAATGFRPIRTRVTALATILVGGQGDVALAPLRGAAPEAGGGAGRGSG